MGTGASVVAGQRGTPFFATHQRPSAGVRHAVVAPASEFKLMSVVLTELSSLYTSLGGPAPASGVYTYFIAPPAVPCRALPMMPRHACHWGEVSLKYRSCVLVHCMKGCRLRSALQSPRTRCKKPHTASRTQRTAVSHCVTNSAAATSHTDPASLRVTALAERSRCGHDASHKHSPQRTPALRLGVHPL